MPGIERRILQFYTWWIEKLHLCYNLVFSKATPIEYTSMSTKLGNWLSVAKDFFAKYKCGLLFLISVAVWGCSMFFAAFRLHSNFDHWQQTKITQFQLTPLDLGCSWHIDCRAYTLFIQFENTTTCQGIWEYPKMRILIPRVSLLFINLH